ncbi:hypothetical protein NKH18_14455 [Streptomyces sp. M10(2022)]
MTVHTSTDLRTTFLFPGQGGFDGEALRMAMEKYPQVRRVFERIDAETMSLFSRRITDLLFGARRTDLRELLDDDAWASQVAIYAAGLAAYEILDAQGCVRTSSQATASARSPHWWPPVRSPSRTGTDRRPARGCHPAAERHRGPDGGAVGRRRPGPQPP